MSNFQTLFAELQGCPNPEDSYRPSLGFWLLQLMKKTKNFLFFIWIYERLFQ